MSDSGGGDFILGRGSLFGQWIIFIKIIPHPIFPYQAAALNLYTKHSILRCALFRPIRECGSTLYVGMTWTAARAAYRVIHHQL